MQELTLVLIHFLFVLLAISDVFLARPYNPCSFSFTLIFHVV